MRVVLVIANSPIAVQNVDHRGRTAMGDILDHDGRTLEHQGSCQGPRNSQQFQEVSLLGGEEEKNYVKKRELSL